jgi:hypothetical protein
MLSMDQYARPSIDEVVGAFEPDECCATSVQHNELQLSNDVAAIRNVQYLPLHNITNGLRLMTLSPSSGDKIECSLENFYLGACSAYEALSYTWSPPMEHHNVYVNGVTFGVRSNLYHALLALRESAPRLL